MKYVMVNSSSSYTIKKRIKYGTKNLKRVKIAALSNLDKCVNCPGLCCSIAGEVDVTKEEIAAIVMATGCVPEEKFNLEELLIRKGRAAACVFLSDDNKCSIYEVRPAVCRDYDCAFDPIVREVRNYLVG
jgi:Fe-S-cluster containining protein